MYAYFLYWIGRYKSGPELLYSETVSTAIAGLTLFFIFFLLCFRFKFYESLFQDTSSVKIIIVSFVTFLVGLALTTLGTYFWIRFVHTDLIPIRTGSIISIVVPAYIQTAISISAFIFIMRFFDTRALPHSIYTYFGLN